MEICSREESGRSGKKTYFTGKLCARGHVAERSVADASCVACSREKVASYREKNRDAINERQRSKYQASPDDGRGRTRNWYAKNAEKARAAAREKYALDRVAAREKIRQNYAKHAEDRRSYGRRYYASNVDALRAKARGRYAKNPLPMKAAEKRRRAASLRSVPSWFGELDAMVWEEASDLVARRRVATGFEWHADHMVPIQAKTVCGLHAWNNCQVIPARMNMFKKNKLILTSPGEWILVS